MSKFIVACGHTASGNAGCGAVDSLDESNCTREIAPLVCTYLEQQGHTTSYLRIDKGNSYNCEDCYTRANQANAIGGDWYVEIHLNSGKEHTGDGAEVCVSSQDSEVNAMASKVATSLSNTLGIDNRGVKIESLIVLKRTSMKAILVECMFVDAKDTSIYNADTIAKAIAEGLTGSTINSSSRKLGWNKNSTGWWYCTDVVNKYYYKDQWKLIDGDYYSFNNKGYAKQSEWEKYTDGKWYYLKKNCVMAKSEWIWWEDDCYYLSSDGSMLFDTVVNGWTLRTDGSWDNTIAQKLPIIK